jgi:peptide/nickel transport system substrate-binding protein
MSSAVAEALRVVVRDHGWRVADRPERVRALLSDALGASAREHRAEVDALVVAAEEGVPALLLGVGPPESLVTEARRRLLDRGLAEPITTLSLLTWGETLELPTSSIAPDRPPTSEPSAGAEHGPRGVFAPSASSDGFAATQLPPVRTTAPVDVVPQATRTTAGTARKGLSLPAGVVRYVAAAVATLALVGGVVGLQALWPDGNGSPGAGTGKKAATGVAGGTLRLYSTSPLTWDPMATTDAGLRLAMNRLLNRGLVAFAPTGDDKPSTVVPDLATDTGRTADRGRTWQFTLRPGARWEDDRPVSCADAKAGFARAADHADLYGYSYEATVLLDLELDAQGLPLHTGAAAGAFDRAVSCSGQTLTVRLSQARLDFPRFLALPELAPYRQGPEIVGIGRRWLSNGPYAVDVTTSTATVGRLVRNARWARSSDPLRLALPDRVEVTAGMDAGEIVDRMAAERGEAGTAASLSPLPPAAATQELADEGERTQVAPNGLVQLLVPNLERPAMRDTRLRQALLASADRAGYCAALGGDAACLELRTLVGVHANSAVQLDRGLLDGYVARGGATGVVVAYRSTPQADLAMKALATGWSATGFAVTLKPFKGTTSAYYEHVTSPAGRAAYDLVRWNLVTPIDPDAETWGLDSILTTGQSTQGVKDPELDMLHRRASTTLDASARAVAWDDVRRRATSQAFVIPLASGVAFVAHGSQLRDVTTLNEFGGVVDPLRISITRSPKETS